MRDLVLVGLGVAVVAWIYSRQQWLEDRRRVTPMLEIMPSTPEEQAAFDVGWQQRLRTLVQYGEGNGNFTRTV
jgi:hypothetical protein